MFKIGDTVRCISTKKFEDADEGFVCPALDQLCVVTDVYSGYVECDDFVEQILILDGFEGSWSADVFEPAVQA